MCCVVSVSSFAFISSSITDIFVGILPALQYTAVSQPTSKLSFCGSYSEQWSDQIFTRTFLTCHCSCTPRLNFWKHTKPQSEPVVWIHVPRHLSVDNLGRDFRIDCRNDCPCHSLSFVVFAACPFYIAEALSDEGTLCYFNVSIIFPSILTVTVSNGHRVEMKWIYALFL